MYAYIFPRGKIIAVSRANSERKEMGGAELAAQGKYESVSIVRDQTNEIQALMKSVLKDGTHFGKIAGCGDKPTLLGAGAEKIALLFGWSEQYSIDRIDLGSGHREYDITCTLSSRKSGEVIGQGIGLCSTMESKYRYRNVSDYEVVDGSIPKDYQQRKQYYRKNGFGAKKENGSWVWVKFNDAQKVENPDIADTYNTVLKMAKKRALVDAVKTCSAASDIFTQDVEDMPQEFRSHSIDPQPIQATVEPAPEPKPKAKPRPKKQPAANNAGHAIKTNEKPVEATKQEEVKEVPEYVKAALRSATKDVAHALNKNPNDVAHNLIAECGNPLSIEPDKYGTYIAKVGRWSTEMQADNWSKKGDK